MGEPDPEWAPRRCACHALCKWHRCAALQCLHHGHAIFQPVVVGSPGRFKSDPGLPRICPARLKLTMTVMSIGFARENGGGCQQPCSRSMVSLMVLTRPSSELAATDTTTSVSTATIAKQCLQIPFI